MSKHATLKTSKRTAASMTDWPRVKAQRDSDIDLSDIPEITAEMAAHGVMRVAGKAVPRGKQRLTMYLDTAIVEYFKTRAGARGYQTLINTALKQAIEHESLENTLRRVIREERAIYSVGRVRRGK
jgi:uncharacterized protein (DUF4415 family)